VESTLETIAVPRKAHGWHRKRPVRLIYDKACDSDALRKRLAKRGIDLICPHCRSRKWSVFRIRAKTGDKYAIHYYTHPDVVGEWVEHGLELPISCGYH
jgi:hypothetical protein